MFESDCNKKLLIDIAQVISPGGTNLYRGLIEGALEAMPSDAQIVLIQQHEARPFDQDERIIVMPVTPNRYGWAGKWIWYNEELPKIIDRTGANVFFSQSGPLSRNIMKTGVATLTTVNNMLPFVSGRQYPFPRLSIDTMKFRILRRELLWACDQADSIIFHSSYARDQVAKYLGRDISDKSRAVLTGMPEELRMCEIPAHPYGDREYLFYLSAIYPHKNHLNLVRAYAEARKTNPQLPDLLFAGPLGKYQPYLRKVMQEVAKLGLTAHVRYLGLLERETIPAWLHHASINLFPSTCETNSVVLAEVMGAQGVLACSNLEPMPEIAGTAAEYFDPFSVESIASAILRLMTDGRTRSEMRARSRTRSEDFSWRRCGEVLWECVELAMINRSKSQVR